MSAAPWAGATPLLFRTSDEALEAVALELTAAAERAIETRGRCLLALDAAAPCLAAYRRWAELTGRRRFWRYLQVLTLRDDVASSAEAGARERLRTALGGATALAAEQVLGSDRGLTPSAAARAYERLLRVRLELRPAEIPVCDRVVVAFEDVDAPARSAGPPGALVHALDGSPGGVTLARAVLARARRVVLVALAPPAGRPPAAAARAPEAHAATLYAVAPAG
jgi:hypothetical protein